MSNVWQGDKNSIVCNAVGVEPMTETSFNVFKNIINAIYSAVK